MIERVSTSLLFFWMIWVGAPAQNRPVFHPRLEIGWLEGESGSAVQASALGSWQIRNWNGGIGTGYDDYLFRSLPFYLQAGYSPGGKWKRFFSDARLGINFPLTRNQVKQFNDLKDYHAYQGAYFDLSLGYSLPVGKKKRHAVLAMMGYSFKSMKEVLTWNVVCINPPCPDNRDTYRYQAHRWSFRIGWRF